MDVDQHADDAQYKSGSPTNAQSKKKNLQECTAHSKMWHALPTGEGECNDTGKQINE